MPHRARDTRSPPRAPSYAGLTRVSIDLRKSFSKWMDCRITSGNDAVFVEVHAPDYHCAEEETDAPPRNPPRRNSRRRTERTENHADRIIATARRTAKPHLAKSSRASAPSP